MAEKADGTLPVVATKRPLPSRTLTRITFSSAKKVNGMILTVRDAASGAANQRMHTGKLQVSSNGGSTWTDLITVSSNKALACAAESRNGVASGRRRLFAAAQP